MTRQHLHATKSFSEVVTVPLAAQRNQEGPLSGQNAPTIREEKQHKHKLFGPDFPRTFLTLAPECPGVKKFLPTTGAAGKHTFWCGRPRFSARTSMTRRVVEKLCTKKVCVDFLAPILIPPTSYAGLAGPRPSVPEVSPTMGGCARECPINPGHEGLGTLGHSFRKDSWVSIV